MKIYAKNQEFKELLRHMKFVIQRVTHADVVVDGNEIGRIGKGFMVLIGVSKEDDKAIADKMVDKMIKLRIFEDENGKTNLSLDDVGGELLLISQFTLYANCKKGNRPSFIDAGAPDEANALYEYIIERCKERVNVVERGEFGADMKVSLLNDGPFTIVLDSSEIM
jgi:D-tyrosyl-tRNA(Tyr) deacylase